MAHVSMAHLSIAMDNGGIYGKWASGSVREEYILQLNITIWPIRPLCHLVDNTRQGKLTVWLEQLNEDCGTREFYVFILSLPLGEHYFIIKELHIEKWDRDVNGHSWNQENLILLSSM